MEIKKIECPSCGAPLEWNSAACGFCKTELRFFEEEGAALPINLSAVDIESNIIMHEKEFWSATLRATDAPYSVYRDCKHWSEQALKKDIWSDYFSKCLKLFYDIYLIMPSENLVGIVDINNQESYILLTSQRLIYIRHAILLPIPLENLISYQLEKSLSGSDIIGSDGVAYVGQRVIRYRIGDSEKEIRFDPADEFINDQVIQSLTICKEWKGLKPLQKNLLCMSRYQLNKTYNIQIKPLELLNISQFTNQQSQSSQAKKGCFVATATMGNYNHPVVLDLQDFRDNYLINKSWGRSFIKWYYLNGPYIASFIEKSNLLKKISYWILIKPLVYISKFISH